MNIKHLRTLKKARLLSDCKIKMSAIAVKGGRVIAVACNTEGSAGKGVYRYSRHAEDNLLRLLNIRRKTGGCSVQLPTIFVFREHGGEMRSQLTARPCRLCQHSLREAGIKKVKYSTEAGWIELRL